MLKRVLCTFCLWKFIRISWFIQMSFHWYSSIKHNQSKLTTLEAIHMCFMFVCLICSRLPSWNCVGFIKNSSHFDKTHELNLFYASVVFGNRRHITYSNRFSLFFLFFLFFFESEQKTRATLFVSNCCGIL